MPHHEDRAAARFMQSTLADLAAPHGTAPAAESKPATVHNMLVGHVGRDVIFLGEVPEGALSALFGARQTG